MRKNLEDALSLEISRLDPCGNLQHPFAYADFELLHHWSVTTAESVAPNESLQRAMREVVPSLAMNHRYLMWVDSLVLYRSCLSI